MTNTRATRRRPRAGRLPPEERRAQLLTAAVSVFGRRGIASARPAEVAAEAGVSEATVFSYFPSRAALRAEVLGEVERFYLAMIDAATSSSAPAPEALLELTTSFADSVDSHPDHARILLEWSAAIREDVWPRHVALRRRMVRGLARLLRRGQRDGSLDPDMNPADEAELIVGSSALVIQMKFSGRGRARVERLLGSLVRTAIRRWA